MNTKKQQRTKTRYRQGAKPAAKPDAELEFIWPPTPVFAHSLVEYLKNQNKLKPAQVVKIIESAKRLLQTLPNVIHVDIADSEELTVVGDVHGQFYDLCNLFAINGFPSPTNPYLFNGDYVDRGSFGVEIVLTLFVFKLVYPNHVHLLRGNHESLTCTREYGFKSEVEDKYNAAIYNLFISAFFYLPLCASVNSRYFVVHGGLFKREGVRLAEIDALDRAVEPGEEGGEGLLSQMLWSDPTDMYGRHGTPRPYGCSFGPNVTQEFLQTNNLQMIIRSHEVRPGGYSFEHYGRLITVFSAPNYCGEVNQGGFLRLVGSSLEVRPHQFYAVPHPPCKSYFAPTVCVIS
eukprot:gnl/Trimastix_PCT/588.p1 GENE.gnl/Trimastix_PCT/588~~gnl/Trimastix_PCT/588.p1  ORF type:complete len:346 (-),score=63.46 gnl/Trimastix_PCT/588:67-1104(-)